MSKRNRRIWRKFSAFNGQHVGRRAVAVRAFGPMPPKGVQDLGFVALDSYATGVVGPAAKIRASYGEGTVIPLFSNHGFLPFLRNLICSMRRLRVNNWLVIAMDNETCPALMGTPGDGEQSACVYPYSHSAIGVTTGTGVATYRSTNFNRMVMQRPLWVRWLLWLSGCPQTSGGVGPVSACYRPRWRRTKSPAAASRASSRRKAAAAPPAVNAHSAVE